MSLTPRLEQMIHEKVASGLFSSASEVVREALRLMDKLDQDELNYRLDAALRAGIEQLEAGQTIPFTRSRFDQIVHSGIESANSGVKLDPDVAPRD